MPIIPSPLRYPGGKAQLYSYIKELLICNDLIGQTYIEPFAGGAGLALKLLLNSDVKKIVINDYDPAIYAFWYSVLNYTEELCSLIETTLINPIEWQRQKEIYLLQDASKPVELGFATFFLNRTNVSGVINGGGIIGGFKQTGKYKIDARYNKNSLINKIKIIAEQRDRIMLSCIDAKELLEPRHLRQYYKAFINFDPPYVNKGGQLYKNSFTHEDHRALFEKIKQCGRKWIVTYDICPLVTELYDRYRSSYIDVNYSVQNNRKAKEYVFFSDNLKLPNGIRLLEKSGLLA